MPMYRYVGILALLWVGLTGVPRTAIGGVEVFCPDETFARRTGQVHCWARFSRADGSRLCVPRWLWVGHLKAGSGSLCGKWEGAWKKGAALSNHPSGGAKIELITFHATQPPSGRSPASWNQVFARRVEAIRERLSSLIERHDPHAVVRSLLLGQTPDRAVSELWRALGFVHLLTATGIHLYVAAGLAHRTVFRIARVLALPTGSARLLGYGLATAICVWIWLLAGARPGMLRPFAVVALRESARYCGIRWRSFAPLVLSLSLDLGVMLFGMLSGDSRPWAPGRLHYATAVGGGLMALEALRRTEGRASPWREHVALALGSWVLTAFVDVFETGRIAPWTPVLSLLSIPLVTTLLYPLLLFMTFGGMTSWIASALDVFAQVLVASTGVLLGASPVWIVPGTSALVACGIGALLWCRRISGTVWLLLVVFKLLLFQASIERGFLTARRSAVASKVEQLDVGQGDAALIHGGGGGASERTGLIDTGSREVITPIGWLELLGRRGIRRLDFIALSHLDEDHAGAVLRVASVMPVDCVATSRAQWESERGMRLDQDLARLGVRRSEWGPGCFPYPVREIDPGGDPSRNNGAMNAFWIPLEGGGGYLSFGDADARTELRALESWSGAWKHPMILKISHHGSRTSTSGEFIRRLRPERAWISSGAGNRHGHPHAEVLERLPGSKLLLERTDRTGVLDSVEVRAAGDRRR